MLSKPPVRVISSTNNSVTVIVTYDDHQNAKSILENGGDPLTEGCQKFTFGNLSDPQVANELTGTTEDLTDLINRNIIEVASSCDSDTWTYYVPFSNGTTTLQEDLKYATTMHNLLEKLGK